MVLLGTRFFSTEAGTNKFVSRGDIGRLSTKEGDVEVPADSSLMRTHKASSGAAQTILASKLVASMPPTGQPEHLHVLIMLPSRLQPLSSPYPFPSSKSFFVLAHSSFIFL
eukprot:15367200-Ditylum_brightwellii.AAC.3